MDQAEMHVWLKSICLYVDYASLNCECVGFSQEDFHHGDLGGAETAQTPEAKLKHTVHTEKQRYGQWAIMAFGLALAGKHNLSVRKT